MTRADCEAIAQASETRYAERLRAKAEGRVTRKAICVHRGERTSAADGKCPQGIRCVKVYECALHGQCTLARKIDGIACCAGCADYREPEHRDSADDGRSG